MGGVFGSHEDPAARARGAPRREPGPRSARWMERLLLVALVLGVGLMVLRGLGVSGAASSARGATEVGQDPAEATPTLVERLKEVLTRIGGGPRVAQDAPLEVLVDEALRLRGEGASQAAIDLLAPRLKALAVPRMEPSPSLARAWNLLGDLRLDRRRYAEARQAYEVAFMTARPAQDLDTAGLAANNLGLLLAICAHSVYGSHPEGPCDLKEAARWFDIAARTRLENADVASAIHSLNNLGMVRFRSGHVEEAREAYADAAAYARAGGTPKDARKALASLALTQAVLVLDSEELFRGSFDPRAMPEEILKTLADARAAARAAGEPESAVCEAWGRYARACRRILGH